jgi:hypothetical protein
MCRYVTLEFKCGCTSPKFYPCEQPQRCTPLRTNLVEHSQWHCPHHQTLVEDARKKTQKQQRQDAAVAAKTLHPGLFAPPPTNSSSDSDTEMESSKESIKPLPPLGRHNSPFSDHPSLPPSDRNSSSPEPEPTKNQGEPDNLALSTIVEEVEEQPFAGYATKYNVDRKQKNDEDAETEFLANARANHGLDWKDDDEEYDIVEDLEVSE